MKKISIHWFRNDLRINDKALLRHDNVKTTEKYLKDTRLTWDKLVEGESFNA